VGPGFASSCEVVLCLGDGGAGQRNLTARGEASFLWGNVIGDAVKVGTDPVRRQGVYSLIICRQRSEELTEAVQYEKPLSDRLG
jgi:hypothetical protein